MAKHVSDGERLVMAMYWQKEKELVQARKELNQLKESFKVMVNHITELKTLNKKLCADVNYLVHKKSNNA